MDSWPINSVLFSSSILLLRLRFGFSLQCTTPMDEPITKADAAAALLHTAQTAATVEQARELFRQAQKDASDQNNIGVLLRVWLRWAEAEARRSQFKAAKRIYEDIVSHSTLSLLPASWLSYAGYCAGRGKVRDARKVYFRGCQMKLMEEDQSSVIWSAFQSSLAAPGDATVGLIAKGSGPSLVFHRRRTPHAQRHRKPPGAALFCPPLGRPRPAPSVAVARVPGIRWCLDGNRKPSQSTFPLYCPRPARIWPKLGS